MPIFEFRCLRCGRKTDALVLSRKRIDEVRCRQCGSAELVKLHSRFATPKSEDARLDALADPSSFAGVDENDPTSVARWMKRMGREMGEDFGEDLDQAIDEDLAGESEEGKEGGGSGPDGEAL